MLVLTREPEQCILLVGPDAAEVRVVVAAVRGPCVHLAFQAPRQIPIYRAELHAALRRSGRQRHHPGTPAPGSPLVDVARAAMREVHGNGDGNGDGRRENELSLTRRRDETVFVGDEDVQVTVVDIRGDRVRLGVQAPRSVSVWRGEVFEAARAAGEPLRLR